VPRESHDQDGQPVRLSDIVTRLGITSRRAVQRIVAELEQAGLAEFERLSERGRPLVVIPRADEIARRNPGQNRTETDEKATCDGKRTM